LTPTVTVVGLTTTNPPVKLRSHAPPAILVAADVGSPI
jgi:hypothetical protein